MTQELTEIAQRIPPEQSALLAGWLPALDSIADGAAVLWPDGRIAYISPRAEQLIGIAHNEIVGQTIHDFPITVTTNDGQPVPDDAWPTRHIVRTGQVIRDIELLFTRRNGSRLSLVLNAAPILDTDGTIAFILVTLLDRTLTQQTALNLRQNERFLASIFTNIQDGISILDHNLTVLAVNPAMERWNAGRMPLVGKRCYEAYHGQTTPCDGCPALKTLQNGESSQAILPLRDGQSRINGWVDLHTFPLLDQETGQSTGIIEYVRNITDQVEAEEELRTVRSEERRFMDRLRALHDVRNALANASTFDMFFSRAVELGHEQLGFERLSIWLIDPSTDGYIGTFGIDEEGHLRDEREQRLPRQPDINPENPNAQKLRGCVVKTDCLLYDHRGQKVGCGSHALTPIRDGQELIGYLSVDNALTQQPLREELCELMELYASILGHRYTRLRVTATLERSEARYRLLTEHVSDLIWSADLNGRFTYVSPSVQIMKGCSQEEYLTLTFRDILTDPSYTVAMRHLHDELELEQAGDADPQRSRAIELEEQRKDGSTIWTESTVSFLRDEQGRAIGILGVSRDITARKQTESRLNYLAYYDALTGLPNRLLLQDRLGRALPRVQREQILIAVMLMDLDRFKEVNDTYGHSAGDQLLVQVARRLNGCVRESDTVARLGGDEFVLMLPAIGSHENAQATVQRVLAAFKQPFPIVGFAISITPSLGICFAPDHADTPELLLQHADLAMYAAKAHGRNNCVAYTPELAEQAELMHTQRP
jgi:diguanylate cyclase (GGDEF)-like protein/PAS domain S-box-containing protein